MVSITKNTRLTTSATLPAMPRPNHSTNSGASAMRGRLFAATTSGATARRAAGERNSTTAASIPLTVPIAKPSSVSMTV